MATGFVDSPVPTTARKEPSLLPPSLLRVCQVDERMSSYGPTIAKMAMIMAAMIMTARNKSWK
jgi:hypothetical protein